VLHRRLHAHDEGLRPALDVLAGQHGAHTRQGQRGRGVDRQQIGMRVRAAQHGRLQRTGRIA
jgi:hypothetical protein